MGARSGRGQNPTLNDPFYSAQPAGGSYLPPLRADPAGLGTYDPNLEYGYTNTGTSPGVPPIENYGTRRGGAAPNNYAGRYAQGFNQAPGAGPWNYGNYYLGNTTMQMLPMARNVFEQFVGMHGSQVSGGFGMLGANQMNPCCPYSSYNNMSMGSPMMGAATPLPVAFNPLVQGMFPMASMTPVNWMAPSSFMSALMTGPMPYRPPVSDFPSNVNMVMAVPFGTPNPAVSSPSFGGGSWRCCCWPNSSPTPSVTPSVSYYPQQINMDSAPVAAAAPIGTGAPLASSYGGFSQGYAVQPSVMASHHEHKSPVAQPALPIYNAANHAAQAPIPAAPLTTTPSQAKYTMPSEHKNRSFSNRLRRFIPSFSRLSRNSSYTFSQTHEYSTRSEPALPPILYGELISDSGWLPKSAAYPISPSFNNRKKTGRPLYVGNHGRSTLHSNGSRVSFNTQTRRVKIPMDVTQSASSVSEYDCAICQQNRDKRRLRDYFGDSIIPTLSSSSKHSKHSKRSKKHQHNSSKNSSSSKQDKQPERQQPKQNVVKSESSENEDTPSIKTASPVLSRRAFIDDDPVRHTIDEEEEEEEEEDEEEELDEDVVDHTIESSKERLNSKSDKSDHRDSDAISEFSEL